MPIMEYCTKHVITGSGNLTVFEATKQMRDKNVGSIVVLDLERKPIGMVTDRDIVLKVVALGKDPRSTLLQDIMSQHAALLRQDQGVFEATKIMSEKGIRRVPVVDAEGRLAGIICLDDLIMVFGEEVANIANAIAYGSYRTEKRNVL
jgi:CBS domain-containing protein